MYSSPPSPAFAPARLLPSPFCRQDQVKAEIMAYLKMMGEVYDVFGLDYKMALSTRPEGYLGELEVRTNSLNRLQRKLWRHLLVVDLLFRP